MKNETIQNFERICVIALFVILAMFGISLLIAATPNKPAFAEANPNIPTTPQRITLVTQQSFGINLGCYILNVDGQEFLVTLCGYGVSTVPLKGKYE
jgi:hypothetical protein